MRLLHKDSLILIIYHACFALLPETYGDYNIFRMLGPRPIETQIIRGWCQDED